MDLCAHNFEKEAICVYLQTHASCPISGKPLSIDDLVPNHSLGERIDRWRWQQRQHRQQQEEPDAIFRQELVATSSAHHNKKQRSLAEKTRYRADDIPEMFLLLPQERAVLEMSQKKLSRRRRCCYCSCRTATCTCLLLGVILLIAGGLLYYYIRVKGWFGDVPNTTIDD